METEAVGTEASAWVDAFVHTLAAISPQIEDERARAVASAVWQTQGNSGTAPDEAANLWLDSDY